MKGWLHSGDGRGLWEVQAKRIRKFPTLQSYSSMIDLICQENCCIAEKLVLYSPRSWPERRCFLAYGQPLPRLDID